MFSPEKLLNQRKKLVFGSVYTVMITIALLTGLEFASRFVLTRFISSQLGQEFDPRYGPAPFPHFRRQVCTGDPRSRQGLPGELLHDPVLGWRAPRNYIAERCHGVYPLPVTVRINSDGFRDGDWDAKLLRASRTGAKKVLLIGDSVLYGLSAEEDERLGEQLAAVYTLHGKPVEIFNAGVPAFGTSQEYRLLPELLARTTPDIVMLLFVDNDYGDTALPYDHRRIMRVYKPFYDEHGRLVLNEWVPRRPSAHIAGTFLDRFYIWYAADVGYFFIQDAQYAKYDIPNPRNAPYPIGWYDLFVYEEHLKARFPYVERTVVTLLGKMRELVERQGGRFLIVSFRQRMESVIADKLTSAGLTFIPTPPEQSRLDPWEMILYDPDHLNFVWAWHLGSKIYSVLEGSPYDPSLAFMPQLAHMPTFLNLGDDRQCAKYLAGQWWPAEPGGRRLGGWAQFMLRNPSPGAPLQLKITGRGQGVPIQLVDSHGKAVCALDLPASMTTVTCLAAPVMEELVFLRLGPTGTQPSRKRENIQERDAGFFNRIEVTTRPQNLGSTAPALRR